MATKKKVRPRLVEAENDALLASLRGDGLPIKKVTFAGKVYWYYLSARGLRLAKERGVGVIDPIWRLATRAASVAALQQVAVASNGHGAEEANDAAMRNVMEEALSRLSFDEMVLGISAARWAGVVPFYPSVGLDDIDARMTPAEMKHVQDQIAEDMLNIVAAAAENADEGTEEDQAPSGN